MPLLPTNQHGAKTMTHLCAVASKNLDRPETVFQCFDEAIERIILLKRSRHFDLVPSGLCPSLKFSDEQPSREPGKRFDDRRPRQKLNEPHVVSETKGYNNVRFKPPVVIHSQLCEVQHQSPNRQRIPDGLQKAIEPIDCTNIVVDRRN